MRKPSQAFILNLVVQTWRGGTPGLSNWVGAMKRFLMLMGVVALLEMAMVIVLQNASVLRGAL